MIDKIIRLQGIRSWLHKKGYLYLWRPINWLSIYGNYSQNFGPSNNLFNSPNQKILPPTLADEWELGAKTEFFEGRLSATFAYFDLTKTNIAVADPINPNVQIASGEQESRGYEFEVAGEMLPGWKIISAYTILDYAKINVGYNGGVDDDTGNRLYNAPRNYGSLWNTYEFQDAVFRGLKFGGGIIASSQSQGTNDNTFQLPGYVTLNLMTSTQSFLFCRVLINTPFVLSLSKDLCSWFDKLTTNGSLNLTRHK